MLKKCDNLELSWLGGVLGCSILIFNWHLLNNIGFYTFFDCHDPDHKTFHTTPLPSKLLL